MTFLQWLQTQKERDDPIGDFASDALSTSDTPTSSSLKIWLAYLVTRRACKEAIQALKDAHKEYKKTESGDDPPDHVYIWGGEGIYKIGRAKNPLQRIRSFPIMPYPTGFAHILLTNDSKRLEHQLHIHFKEQRIQGEWFRLTDNDLATIPDIAKVPLVSEAEISSQNSLWQVLITAEPRLQSLYNEAHEITGNCYNDGKAWFCANEIWYTRFKPRLLQLVGWEAKDPRLKTQEAYDTAYEKIYNRLPDCSGCSCI